MGAAAKNLRPKPEVEDLLRRLESLPTLPSVMYELNRLINDPTSSAGDVTKVMEKDQSLTGKVLKVVNSAYYAIPGGITSLHRAIAYLGYDTINQLVLAASVFKTMNKTSKSKFNLNDYWKHSVGVAMTAETLAKWCNHTNPSECFTGGLLHDVGKLALYHVAPDYWDAIVSEAFAKNITVTASELNLNIMSHTEVGALLVNVWKLPSVLEYIISYHHELNLAKRHCPQENNHTIDIVALANKMVHDLDFGNSGHTQKFPADGNLLKRINLNSIQLPLILKDVLRNLSNADDFIKIIS
jgi:putative nucleotidyltransferase with HDIG domain